MAIKNRLLMQKNKRDLLESVYISRNCAIPVVPPAVLAWVCLWLAPGVTPMGGLPRLLFAYTPSDFSLEYSSGYALVTLKSNS